MWIQKIQIETAFGLWYLVCFEITFQTYVCLIEWINIRSGLSNMTDSLNTVKLLCCVARRQPTRLAWHPSKINVISLTWTSLKVNHCLFCKIFCSAPHFEIDAHLLCGFGIDKAHSLVAILCARNYVHYIEVCDAQMGQHFSNSLSRYRTCRHSLNVNVK